MRVFRPPNSGRISRPALAEQPASSIGSSRERTAVAELAAADSESNQNAKISGTISRRWETRRI
jgi:hypothetical protein